MALAMTSYGHAYLTSYGWTGTGTGLRNGAIIKPIAIPPKKNLSGLGKDRDEAFPFWEHLFTAASKAITIRVSSDDEDEDTKNPTSHTDHLRRTSTGILSNRLPALGTPASTSGTSTPKATDAQATVRLSLLATAKKEAAKRGLYSRFFRGPVLGPCDTDAGPSEAVSTLRPSAPVQGHASEEQDGNAGETKLSKKRKSEDRTETKAERRERKRSRKEHRVAKAARRAEKALTKKMAKEASVTDRKDGHTGSEENEISSSLKRACERPGKPLGDGLDPAKHTDKKSPVDAEQQDSSDALNTALTKRKKGKRKNTLP